MRIEDPNYLDKLYYEIIPKNVSYLAPRLLMGDNQWQKIIKYARKRANFQCEICKNSSSKLHIHERYGICDDFLILKRLICVCEHCHFVIHPRYSFRERKEDQIFRLYSRINQVSRSKAENDYIEAMSLYLERDNICDVDWAMIASDPYNKIIDDNLVLEEAINSYHACENIIPLAYIF